MACEQRPDIARSVQTNPKPFHMTSPDSQIVQAAIAGKLLDFCMPGEDKAPKAEWGEERTIDAAVIVQLCGTETPYGPIHPKGIHIRGARISGSLELEGKTIDIPLFFEQCWIEQPIQLKGSHLNALALTASRISGFRGERLVLNDTLYVNEGFCCEGEISLVDAGISGSLMADGAVLKNDGGTALNAERLQLGGGLHLSNVEVQGGIQLQHALIGKNLSSTGGHFRNWGKYACIDARHATIKGDVLFDTDYSSEPDLRRYFSTVGSIVLSQGRIEGHLRIQGAHLTNPLTGALWANNITVMGSVLISGLEAKGIVSFAYGNIAHTFECTEYIRLSHPGYIALDAKEMTTGKTVKFGWSFKMEETINLTGADVGGALIFLDGDFTSEGLIAINANRITVRQDVLFDSDFEANGEVRFIGASIGGSFSVGGGKLRNKGQIALDASLSTFGGKIEFKKDTELVGRCSFNGSKIGDQFYAPYCKFLCDGQVALLAENMVTAADMVLEGSVIDGGASLRNADIGGDLRLQEVTIDSQSEVMGINASGLSVKGSVFLHGFVSRAAIYFTVSYIRKDFVCMASQLENGGKSQNNDPVAFDAQGMKVEGTLFWQSMKISAKGLLDFSTATVGQLVDDISSWPAGHQLVLDNFAFHSFGEPSMSVHERRQWLCRQKSFNVQPYDQVAMALRRASRIGDARRISRAKQNDLRKYGKMGRWEKVTNWFLDFTIGQGYQVWRVVLLSLAVVIAGSFIFNEAHLSHHMLLLKNEAHPAFQPFVYSIDVFLPIVNLHQKDYWLPDTAHPGSYFYMIWLWVQICLGWILTTLAVAGLTGIVKKD